MKCQLCGKNKRREDPLCWKCARPPKPEFCQILKLGEFIPTVTKLRGRTRKGRWAWTDEGKAHLSAQKIGDLNPMWKGGSSKDPVAKAQYTRQWRKDNEDYVRDREYRKRFGITKAQYDALLSEQGGSCAICKSTPGRRRLDVDHCHLTGKVRGLLCETCNKTLGFFNDDPELLKAALKYLEEVIQLPSKSKSQSRFLNWKFGHRSMGPKTSLRQQHQGLASEGQKA